MSFVLCPACKGKGTRTDYDRGWRALDHDELLEVPMPCELCYSFEKGTGAGRVDTSKAIQWAARSHA